MKKWLCILSFLIVAVNIAAGCHKKRIVKTADIPNNSAIQATVSPGITVPIKQINLNDSRINFQFEMVHFNFDDAHLNKEDTRALYLNALILKANPKMNVNAEGHCDNRGTNAYNLALGERRARVIEQYYLSMGIEQRRVGHVSYGEEIPYCTEDTETCWAQNRRGVTVEIK